MEMNNLTDVEASNFKEFCSKKLKPNKEFMQLLNAAPKKHYKILVDDNDFYIKELKRIAVSKLNNNKIKQKIGKMSYYEFAELLFAYDECFYKYI